MLKILCRSRFVCCCTTYFIYLFALWLLFIVVRYSSPIGSSYYDDNSDSCPMVCNVEAEALQERMNGTPGIMAVNRSTPKCLKDTSMFKIGPDSQLFRLHLDSLFWKSTRCCYYNFWRMDEEPDLKISRSSACYEITKNITEIPSHQDFLRIICKTKNTSTIVYQDQLAHVRMQKTYRSIEDPDQWSALRKDKLSIMIFGMRSMSRLNFIHNFPKTHKFLTNNLNAYEFPGYNSIGQGQVQNIYPLFSGLPYKQFYRKCSAKEKYFLDSCPFEWRKIYKYGYQISFQEEHQGPSLFTIGSRYYRNGFRKVHFNYDLRVLNHNLEFLKLGHISNNQSRTQHDQCYGPRLSSKSCIHNFGLTARAFTERSHLHMTWTQTLNENPKINDQLLLEMLEELKATGSLKQTALIFISDEGLGAETSKFSQSNYLHRRLPIFYVVLPQWFKNKYPLATKNFQVNTKRLVTTLDVFKTFIQIFDATRLDEFFVRRNVFNNVPYTSGISLFSPIPRNRTCENAGVSDLLCACLPRRKLSVNSVVVQNATDFLISTFNKQLGLFPNCAKLKLKEIISAYEFDKLNSERSFIITFTGDYGDVIWEGTVKQKQERFQFEDIRFINYSANVTLCITHNEDYSTCICKLKDGSE